MGLYNDYLNEFSLKPENYVGTGADFVTSIRHCDCSIKEYRSIFSCFSVFLKAAPFCRLCKTIRIQ